MNKSGCIIIIEDDKDDQYMMASVYNELGFKNEIIFFDDGNNAMQYLREMVDIPFLIISDINMPILDGIQLRKELLKNDFLNLLAVPYLILSTSTNRSFVDKAFSSGMQGYFEKPSTYKELKELLCGIIQYWKSSFAPSTFITAPAFM